MTALLRTTTTPQKNSVLPLRHLYPYPYQGLTYFLIILVVFSVNLLFFVFSFPITLFFLFLFNLLYFCYSSSFEASISTFFFLLILHLFSLSTFFFGKDPMILLSCFFSPFFSCFLHSLVLLFCTSYLSCFYSFSFSVFCQFSSFLYTTHVPFHTVLSSPFCVFSFSCHSLFHISFSVFVSIDLTFPLYFLDLLLYIFSFCAFLFFIILVYCHYFFLVLFIFIQ